MVRSLIAVPVHLQLVANDPTAVEIAKNLKLSPEEATDSAKSVISIKVSAIKPAVG